MSPFEIYFVIVNLIFTSGMLMTYYMTVIRLNKKKEMFENNRKELDEMNIKILAEEDFYKTIIQNLTDYLNLIRKSKKPVSVPVMKPEKIQENKVPNNDIKEPSKSYFNLIRNLWNRETKVEEVKKTPIDIKSPAPMPLPTNAVTIIKKSDKVTTVAPQQQQQQQQAPKQAQSQPPKEKDPNYKKQ